MRQETSGKTTKHENTEQKRKHEKHEKTIRKTHSLNAKLAFLGPLAMRRQRLVSSTASKGDMFVLSQVKQATDAQSEYAKKNGPRRLDVDGRNGAKV